MPPAARVSDMHTCPMVTVVVPHVGGPILPPGCLTILIGGLPAARMGDLATCTGPPDFLQLGWVTWPPAPGRRTSSRSAAPPCFSAASRPHGWETSPRTVA